MNLEAVLKEKTTELQEVASAIAQIDQQRQALANQFKKLEGQVELLQQLAKDAR